MSAVPVASALPAVPPASSSAAAAAAAPQPHPRSQAAHSGLDNVDADSEAAKSLAAQDGGAAGVEAGELPARPAPAPLDAEELALVDATVAELVRLRECERASEVSHNITPQTIVRLCKRVEDFFLFEDALLHISAPVNIVGDIHGQFLDLLRYFEVGGFPPDASYLFLGDYVDRGKNGIEATLLLFCFKLKYPDKFWMLRGNHECSQISRLYGFHDEYVCPAAILVLAQPIVVNLRYADTTHPMTSSSPPGACASTTCIAGRA